MDLVSAGMLGLVFLTHYIHYVYCLSLLVFVASIQSMGGGGVLGLGFIEQFEISDDLYCNLSE